MASSPESGLEGQRALSDGEGLDGPVHHGADIIAVFDADAGVPGEALAVGAEQDVVPEAGPDGLPHDGLHLWLVVVALLGAEAVVTSRAPLKIAR